MDILNWIMHISQSTTPGKGFHAQWLYVICTVFVPAIIGALITYSIMFLEKVLKLHNGGH